MKPQLSTSKAFKGTEKLAQPPSSLAVVVSIGPKLTEPKQTGPIGR